MPGLREPFGGDFVDVPLVPHNEHQHDEDIVPQLRDEPVVAHAVFPVCGQVLLQLLAEDFGSAQSSIRLRYLYIRCWTGLSSLAKSASACWLRMTL